MVKLSCWNIQSEIKNGDLTCSVLGNSVMNENVFICNWLTYFFLCFCESVQGHRHGVFTNMLLCYLYLQSNI